MNLELMLQRFRSIVLLLEKIEELGGAYDLLPEGYALVLDGIQIYPAFQYVDNADVKNAINQIANHYALLGDSTKLATFSFLVTHWDDLKTGERRKIDTVLKKLNI